jgi:NAD(P)-dependent dehydrogenase (short-subunit alcohol dehydrogenase family)
MESKKRLQDKVAVITGAATGIGEAIAHKFALEGAQLVVCGLKDDPVLDVVNKINTSGGKAIPFQGDISLEDEAKHCIELTLKEYGRIDVLVANAGVYQFTGETQDYPTKYYESSLKNNISTVFFMVKHALPQLQKSQGNIVATGSEAGLIGHPMNSVYGASKAWIHGFIEGVAVEQAKYNVRANCVCPGPIDTAWTHRKEGPLDFKLEKTMISAIPLGRRGTVEEMANVFAFLASDEASFITGALWEADGGITKSKGAIAMEAIGKDVRKAPQGKIMEKVEHTQEGLKNKDYQP